MNVFPSNKNLKEKRLRGMTMNEKTDKVAAANDEGLDLPEFLKRNANPPTDEDVAAEEPKEDDSKS
jgi:hypothetical protein